MRNNFWVTWSVLRNSFLCISDIRYKPENLCMWLIDMNLPFWTYFRKKWGVPVNISLIFVVLLYCWVVDVDVRLMISEVYSEPSRTVTMGLFAKSSIVNVRLGSKYATGLGYYKTILLSWLSIYIRTSKMLQEWPCILLRKNYFLKKH